MTYRFADINFSIESLYPGVHRLCAGYRTDSPPDYIIRTDERDIMFERQRSTIPDAGDDYLETLAVYRKIAEITPYHDTVLFHGSAIAVDGEAYIFAAVSGTGKSTHARLWRELFGSRALMVNDDKPLIRITDTGATVCGTPWDGKHRLSSNISVPVKAIAVIERAPVNSAEAITRSDILPTLIRQTYRPIDPGALSFTLSLIDRLNVGFFRVRCNMEPEAAAISYEAMKK